MRFALINARDKCALGNDSFVSFNLTSLIADKFPDFIILQRSFLKPQFSRNFFFSFFETTGVHFIFEPWRSSCSTWEEFCHNIERSVAKFSRFRVGHAFYGNETLSLRGSVAFSRTRLSMPDIGLAFSVDTSPLINLFFPYFRAFFTVAGMSWTASSPSSLARISTPLL